MITIQQEITSDDLDSYGHVNNVRFYEFAQTARQAFMIQHALAEDSFTIVVYNCCHYLKEVHFPDVLAIEVCVKAIGNTSITHAYTFFSESQQTIVAKAESVMVVMDKATRTKRQISRAEAAMLRGDTNSATIVNL